MSLPDGPYEVNPFERCTECGHYGARYSTEVRSWEMLRHPEIVIAALVPVMECERCKFSWDTTRTDLCMDAAEEAYNQGGRY